MNAVTIGADRRLPFSPCHRLAVDTLFEFLRHAAVTLSTRDWDIELENGRFGICRSQNFVGSVTVRTNSGRLHAFGHCSAVYALLIRNERLRAAAARFHDKFLAVTPAAGGGDVRVIGTRLGITRSQEFVRAAVAVDAGGHWVAVFHYLGVEAAVVGCLLFAMAGRARDLGWRGFMWRVLDVSMAVNTRKHATVH